MKTFVSVLSRSNILDGRFIKVKSAVLALVLISSQVAGVALPFMPIQVASAATPNVCTVDVQGANDEPGQKDLNLFCKSTDDIAGEITIAWQWDEIAWSGNNTGDACALFDTNNNNFSNYAVCVTVSGDPATQLSGVSPRIYTCNDTALEKCAGANLVVGPYQTICSVSISSTDPFTTGASKIKGASQPKDTRALCVIKLSEVGAGSAVLKDVCSFPSQQPNSDPSDCVVTPTGSDNPSIELIKDIVPNTDSGRFNLKIDLLVDVVATNVGDGGTTGETEFTGNTVVVEETAFAGTMLANYTTRLICINDDATAAAFLNIPVTGVNSRTATVNLPNGVTNITCTFVNTRTEGSLTVVKNLITDNGATQKVTDFGFKVDGGTTIPFEADASNTISYPTGTVIAEVTEPAVSGFTTTYDNCSNLTIVAGQTRTCTITNNDIQPKITLTKVIDGVQYGDTSTVNSFGLTIGGTPATSGTTYGKNVGSYALNENVVTGYSFVNITGDAKCPTTLGGTVNLLPGDNVSCSIHNVATAPVLKLKKVAINDNGGTMLSGSFNLKAGSNSFKGGNSVKVAFEPTKTTTTYVTGLGVGSYVLSEDPVTGYDAGSWSCDKGLVGSTVTVSLGDHITCTVTNNDKVPSLTLIKYLTDNYSSGMTTADWILTATGPTTISGNGGVTSTETFNTGNYTLSEAANKDVSANGFTSGAWICNETTLTSNVISILLGDNKTCSIRNTSVQPKIKVIKHVVDNYGGNKDAEHFTMSVTGTDVTLTPGETGLKTMQTFPGNEDGTYIYLDAGVYKVSETEVKGYIKSTAGDCQGSIKVGEVKVCTITNTAVQPKLIVKKHVINDNGGKKEAKHFTMTVGGNSQKVSDFPGNEDGTEILLNVGNYSVFEILNNAYAATISSDCVGSISVGETKTCTITNDDKQGTLTINKVVVNDNGGTASASDFSFNIVGDSASYKFVNGNTDNVGSMSFSVNAGKYSAVESSLKGTGYKMTGNTCNDVIVANGSTGSCTITNDDIQPKLIVKKHVINDNSGVAVASDFSFQKSGHEESFNFENNSENPLYGSRAFDVNAGTYTITENNYEGYEMESSTCSNVKVEIGKIVTCHIVNNDIPNPAISVVKTGPKYAKAGETVTYTFTVNNTGDIALNDITVVDTITGNGTYVSGDTDKDNMLDVSETWIYTGQYTIPANQKADVKNTVEVCGYDSPLYNDKEILSRLSVQTYTEEEVRNQVCAEDSHSLSVPQVLGETTELVDTSGTRSTLYTIFAALNIALVVGALVLTRRRNSAL